MSGLASRRVIIKSIDFEIDYKDEQYPIIYREDFTESELIIN